MSSNDLGRLTNRHDLGRLVDAAGLILYKFTEGSEDWSEYLELHAALEPYVLADLPTDVRFRLVARLDEYEDRLYKP